MIEEIAINDDAKRENHHMVIHWKGGVHTELTVPRNRKGQNAIRTEKTALELIEELSKVCSDQTIAATLNRLGLKTGGGKTWRIHSVQTTRSYYKLTNHRNSDLWLTIEQVASETEVSHTVIRRLIREEILPATQLAETTPWIIERCSLELPEVQEAISAVKEGRQLRSKNDLQLELPLE